MDIQYQNPWNKQEKKWDFFFLNRADFWMIWRRCDIPCFHFYFLFRNNGRREQLDDSDFRHCESVIFYFSQLFPKFFLKITTCIDNVIWKTPYSWIFHGHGSTQVQIILWVNISKQKLMQVPRKLSAVQNYKPEPQRALHQTFHLLLYTSLSLK